MDLKLSPTLNLVTFACSRLPVGNIVPGANAGRSWGRMWGVGRLPVGVTERIYIQCLYEVRYSVVEEARQLTQVRPCPNWRSTKDPTILHWLDWYQVIARFKSVGDPEP